MRRVRLLLLAGAALFAAPASAQNGKEDVARLQAQLEEARATIRQLEQRLTAVEGRLAAGAPAAAQPAGAADAGAEPPTIDLTAPDGGPDLASAGAEPPERPPTWELAPPGPLDRPLPGGRPGRAAAFELLAGTGGGRASFALTRSKDRDTGPASGRTVGAVNDTVRLALSAPLSKEGDTSFATLDGLASGTKLELGYTQFRGKILTAAADEAHPLLVQARQRCRDSTPPYKPGCTRLDEAFLSKFLSPEERRQFERDYARATLQSSWAWAVHAAVGYDEFSFYPLPTLAKTTVNRMSWSLGAGLTLFPVDRSSLSFNLDYQRSFKGRKAVVTCPVPAAGALSVSCVPGPLQGPVRSEELIFAPEFRYFVPVSENGLIRNLGFAPRVEVDLLSGDAAFDMPIYFAQDEKDGLIGGIRIGYTTSDDDFMLGLFIGKKFSIFQ
jgi:hypothetical protein